MLMHFLRNALFIQNKRFVFQKENLKQCGKCLKEPTKLLKKDSEVSSQPLLSPIHYVWTRNGKDGVYGFLLFIKESVGSWHFVRVNETPL